MHVPSTSARKTSAQWKSTREAVANMLCFWMAAPWLIIQSRRSVSEKESSVDSLASSSGVCVRETVLCRDA